MKQWLSMVVIALMVLAGPAEAAKRLGGGKSFGQQSSNVTQRQAPAAPNAAPGAQAAPAKAGATAGAAAAAPKKPWGAMLGGLAAGLGLAWLAHTLGFGEGLAQFLMFALLALVAMAVVGWLLRSRRGAAGAPTPFAMQGATAGSAPVPASYRPENVGNDASARPWERSTTAFDAAGAAGQGGAGAQGGSMIGSALSGQQTWGIPAGFDTDGFLASAKANFVALQAAWDRSDIGTLRAMMTDTMLQEIKAQLADRESHTGGPVNATDVVMIEAHLLGIEDLGHEYMASVEFSGMIREQPSAGPSPFREVWNMTKPKAGQHGWLVAGVQALQ
ncbi:MAG: TIM44-like domain-containing protein [Rhodoferax sp.]